MKPEWITDNVKRAWLTQQNVELERISGVSGLAQPHDFNTASSDYMKTLEGALDLLHFAAERAGHHYNVGINNDGISTDSPFEVRVIQSEMPYHFIDGPRGKREAESLLHAVLLAIDAIVEHKKEAFA